MTNDREKRKPALILILGDIILLFFVTLSGFATHGTMGNAGVRMLSTFIPLVISWFAIAPFMGVYQDNLSITPSQLWRPFWAMVVGAPLAAFLRGLWLNTPVLPLFVIVIGGIASLAILSWRAVYCVMMRRGRTS